MQDVASDVRGLFLRFSLMESRVEPHHVLAFLDRVEELFERYRQELESIRQTFLRMGALHAELGIDNGIMSFSAHIAWVRYARKRIAGRRTSSA